MESNIYRSLSDHEVFLFPVSGKRYGVNVRFNPFQSSMATSLVFWSLVNMSTVESCGMLFGMPVRMGRLVDGIAVIFENKALFGCTTGGDILAY